MAWRSGEMWLDTDVLWFREHPPRRLAPVLAAAAVELPAFLSPVETGLDASRRRRLAAEAERRRRFATRTVPAVALVVGSATMLPIGVLRHRAAVDAAPLPEDPPSLSSQSEVFRFRLPERTPVTTEAAQEPARVQWRRATAVGLQYAGQLVNGTQLPLEGPDWITWNPNTDSTPNLPSRLHGHERTIRAVLTVVAAYRAAHPDAPKVVVGDISLPDGGPIDQHVSHQNGLDVDVYYPRRDGRASAPTSPRQIDRHLAQDLLDRFVAVGAKVVFVGYATGLRGPHGVVVPYPNHENHMHVRFRSPG